MNNFINLNLAVENEDCFVVNKNHIVSVRTSTENEPGKCVVKTLSDGYYPVQESMAEIEIILS